MMTSMTFLFSLTYSFLFFLFFNLSSMFLFWCLIELSIMIYILILYSSSGYSQEAGSSSLFYFVIQVYSSILLIYSFCSHDLSDVYFLKELLIVISLSLKISIFPFHLWSFKLSEVLNPGCFWLLMSLHKVPILFFLFQMCNSIILSELLVCLIMGAIMILFSQTMNHLIISSSLYSLFWVYLIFNLSLYYFLFFNLFYFASMYFLLFNQKSRLSSFYSVLFFLGLPPASLFFFKYDIMFLVTSKLSDVEFFLVWLFSFLSLFGYMKHFFNFFFLKFSLYLKNEIFSKMMSFFYFTSIFSLFFLLYLE